MNVLHVTQAGSRPSGAVDPVERLAELVPVITLQRVDVHERDLRTAVRRQSADVTAAASLRLADLLATIKGSRDGGRPCVVYGGPHADDRPAGDHPQLYDSLCQCLYIAGTRYEADYVTTRGVPAERVFVIGPGVDPERFDRARPSEVRSKLGLRDDHVVGLVDDTGVYDAADTAVTAMERVWRHLPGAQLLIAGTQGAGSEWIAGRMATLPVERQDRIVLKPDLTDRERAAVFSAIDVLVSPTGSESFSIPIIEAWAAGKPVIAARQGAAPTVIDDGVDGVLVEYGHANGLGVSIVELLQNRTRAEQMGQAGRGKVLIRHTWSRVAEQFEQVFRIAVASAG